MSIEERVASALLDLEGLLAEGVEIDMAIREVSTDHGLSQDVIRTRGERAFGDLASVRGRSEAAKNAVARQIRLKALADQYFREDHERAWRKAGEIYTVDDWAKARFAEPMSGDEVKFVRQRVQTLFQEMIMRPARADLSNDAEQDDAEDQ